MVPRIALKYLLVTAFVGGIVAVIWSGHISDHIKYVDYVPPPITAPARQNQPRNYPYDDWTGHGVMR
jgi:hypothetical protein